MAILVNPPDKIDDTSSGPKKYALTMAQKRHSIYEEVPSISRVKYELERPRTKLRCNNRRDFLDESKKFSFLMDAYRRE